MNFNIKVYGIDKNWTWFWSIIDERESSESLFFVLYIPICYFDETSTETRAAISHPKISLAAEAKLFSSRNIRKREVVVCSRSDHESFSGVPFHGNCVVPWIVSVFCQRWLLLRLIGQLDVRPEVAPPEKGRTLLCEYIENILQFYVN